MKDELYGMESDFTLDSCIVMSLPMAPASAWGAAMFSGDLNGGGGSIEGLSGKVCV